MLTWASTGVRIHTETIVELIWHGSTRMLGRCTWLPVGVAFERWSPHTEIPVCPAFGRHCLLMHHAIQHDDTISWLRFMGNPTMWRLLEGTQAWNGALSPSTCILLLLSGICIWWSCWSVYHWKTDHRWSFPLGRLMVVHTTQVGWAVLLCKKPSNRPGRKVWRGLESNPGPLRHRRRCSTTELPGPYTLPKGKV
jgi:hypothetical protein